MRGISFLILTAILLCFQFNETYAQSDLQGSGISVVPAITEIVAQPGEPSTLNLKITNISQVPLPITIYTQPIKPIDQEVDGTLRSRFDASTWLEPISPNLVLDINETKDIKITLNPPIDAGPGGHYALITFRILSPQNSNYPTSTQITPEVSSVIFVTVPGLVEEKAEINFINQNNIQIKREREFTFEFTNLGNIHLLPTARIDIKDTHGQIIDTISYSQRLILPNTKAVFSVDWEPKSDGKYSAELIVSYGTPNQSQTLISNSFWVLPGLGIIVLWLFLLLLLILIILFIIKRFIIRKYFNRKKFYTDRTNLLYQKPSVDFDELVNDQTIFDRSRKK